MTDLCRAEKRLLGLSSTGPMGSMVPRSLTQCRYPRVMSAMPMALAEQYMNLYPFLRRNKQTFTANPLKKQKKPQTEGAEAELVLTG